MFVVVCGCECLGGDVFVCLCALFSHFIFLIFSFFFQVSTPSLPCVFSVVGPGAEKIGRRLHHPNNDTKVSAKNKLENENNNDNKREFIVEWDFEVENKVTF